MSLARFSFVPPLATLPSRLESDFNCLHCDYGTEQHRRHVPRQMNQEVPGSCRESKHHVTHESFPSSSINSSLYLFISTMFWYMNTRAYVRVARLWNLELMWRSAISFKRPKRAIPRDHPLYNSIHSSPLERDVSLCVEAAKENWFSRKQKHSSPRRLLFVISYSRGIKKRYKVGNLKIFA